MVDCVARYRKALKKNLRCPRSVRERLMNKFAFPLSRFLEENPDTNTEALYAAFGSPSEMAEILMVEVTAEEKSRYRKNRLIRRVSLGVVTVILISACIAFARYTGPGKEQDKVQVPAVYFFIDTQKDHSTISFADSNG